MLVASAQGDLARVERALSAFMAASSQHCDGLDLMLGKSGVLAVAATLLDWVPYAAPASRARLLAFGDSLASALWTRLSGMAAIGAAPEMPTLGIAHGWAGVLFAVLSWSLAAGQPPPATMRERLTELADQRVPWASGARWPIGLRDGDHVGFATSWCNGSSGYVFLWTAARAALGDDRFLEFAEDAAWNVWEGSRGSGNLCCGEAGAAYALLNLYRASGDVRWRARAEQLAYRASDFAGADAAQYSGYRQSLFKGALGIAVLAADLAEPQRARLPFFEPDAYAR
jgi:serine/threonine-protein kinase